jgi:hypothetical protein
MLLFEILHVSTCKNCKRHTRQVHCTACTRWLIDVAWSGRCEVKAYGHRYTAPLSRVTSVGSLALYLTSSVSFWTDHVSLQVISTVRYIQKCPVNWRSHASIRANMQYARSRVLVHGRSPTWERTHAVAWLVEALCYKPEGCELDSQWGHWIFQLT